MEQDRRTPSAYLLVAFFALFTLFSVIAFARGWRVPVATREGAGIDGVINYLLVATAVLCVIGHLVLCWFIWRSIRGGGEYRRPSAKVEWLWGLAPVLVLSVVAEAGVLVAGTPVWKDLFLDEPKDPLVVEVVGKQFEWLVRYPGEDGEFLEYSLKDVRGSDNPLGLDEFSDKPLDDVVKRGELVLPVGRPALLRLRTHDVIHSFFVPAFRVKQDLIPGYATRVKFTPTKTGTYELACAELCGLGHYKMRGVVRVVEPAAFEAWLASQTTFGG